MSNGCSSKKALNISRENPRRYYHQRGLFPGVVLTQCATLSLWDTWRRRAHTTSNPLPLATSAMRVLRTFAPVQASRATVRAQINSLSASATRMFPRTTLLQIGGSCQASRPAGRLVMKFHLSVAVVQCWFWGVSTRTKLV